MLNYTYEVKGMSVQTSFFIEHLERQVRENSKYYGLSASFAPRSSDCLTVTLAHNDMTVIQKFLDWLKSASKGVSKVTGVRKL
ncbi:MAG: hypothetical protein WC285_04920 [Candidatus Gracilibacteria bacterium]|jgi:hypothetical protein